MCKEKLIKNLLDKKQVKNNTIDLNAYSIGLSDMFEALLDSHDILKCSFDDYVLISAWKCLFINNVDESLIKEDEIIQKMKSVLKGDIKPSNVPLKNWINCIKILTRNGK